VAQFPTPPKSLSYTHEEGCVETSAIYEYSGNKTVEGKLHLVMLCRQCSLSVHNGQPTWSYHEQVGHNLYPQAHKEKTMANNKNVRAAERTVEKAEKAIVKQKEAIVASREKTKTLVAEKRELMQERKDAKVSLREANSEAKSSATSEPAPKKNKSLKAKKNKKNKSND